MDIVTCGKDTQQGAVMLLKRGKQSSTGKAEKKKNVKVKEKGEEGVLGPPHKCSTLNIFYFFSQTLC